MLIKTFGSALRAGSPLFTAVEKMVLKPFLLLLLLVAASISRRWPDLRVGSSVLFRIAKREDSMAPLGGDPRLVLLFSGKRKSGKDFVTEALQSRLGADVCAVLRLSSPLKEQYAQEHGLDFQRLLDASAYKEAYRRDMILWGEEKRQADPGFFCRRAVEGVSQPVWLVSDTRRMSDIQWFRETYGAVTQTVRVVALEQSRQQRGWVFTAGVDDGESECGLDNFGDFDWVIENHGDEQRLEEQLEDLVEFVRTRL